MMFSKLLREVSILIFTGRLLIPLLRNVGEIDDKLF